MSKAVKKVGRAIGKVVKGAVKVVKKVASSKIGKILIGAATIYFGGAAIMGAMGGASAGTGVIGTIGGALKGAAAGISSAWSGLTGAASAAMGGQFSAAGSSLGSGFTGAYSAGSGAVTGAAGTAVNAAAAATTPAVGATEGVAFYGANAPVAVMPTVNAATSAGAGAAGGATAGTLTGMSPLTQYGLISGGTQLASGLIQGAGQQKALEEQRKFELDQQQAARDRYNENVGANWWSGSGNEGAASPSTYAQAPQSGLIAGYMTPQERYAEDMRRRMLTYNPYALPTA